MPTAVIAVPDSSPFVFDFEAFSTVVRSRWPDAGFVPATGRVASVSRGQWRIPHSNAYPEVVLVDFDVEGRGLAFDSLESEIRAEVIALATTVPGFPDDGSVVLAEWAHEFIPLCPSTTAAELLAQMV